MRRFVAVRRTGARLGRLALVALAAVRCAPPEITRYASPPWPADRTAVVLFVDATAAVIGEPRVFAAGAPIALVAPEAAERVLVATYLDPSGDIARCGARVGGERPALPTPNEVFDAATDDAFTLEARGPLGVELRYATCEPEGGPACPTLEVTRLETDFGPDNYVHALAVHEGELYASGGDGPIQHQLWRLEGERFVPVPLPAPIGDPDKGMRTLTSHEGRLWMSQASRIYALDADLQVVASTVAPDFVQRLVGDPAGGPLFALSDEQGEGMAVDLTGTLPPLGRSGGAVLDGPDSWYVLQSYGVAKWSGQRWEDVHIFRPTEAFNSLWGDRDLQIAGNPLGKILVHARDEWRTHDAAESNGLHIRTAAHVGGGRAVVAGSDGYIALWDVDHWCVPTGRLLGNSMLTAVVHDGAVYLGGDDYGGVEGDAPPIVRVRILAP